MESKFARRAVLKGGIGFGMAGLGAAAGLLKAPKAMAAGGSPVKVNIINPTGSLTLAQNVMFEDLGLFKKYGVEANITNVSDGSKIIAALVSGEGDICGGSGFGGLFPAIQKGAPVKIVCGANIAPLNIIYANNSHPEIKSVKDLVGCTVGTGAPGALLHSLTVAVLKKYGVDYKKVNFVNVGSSRSVFKALSGGTVDAGVAPIEFRDTAAKYNIHPLDDGEFWKELPLFTNQAMYASNKAIEEKREGLIGLMAAYGELFRWIADPANAEDFKKYYRQALGDRAEDETIEFYRKFLSEPNRFATDLVLSKEQIDYVQQLNIDIGIQKELLPYDQATDMSLAAEAFKRIQS